MLIFFGSIFTIIKSQETIGNTQRNFYFPESQNLCNIRCWTIPCPQIFHGSYLDNHLSPLYNESFNKKELSYSQVLHIVFSFLLTSGNLSEGRHWFLFFFSFLYAYFLLLLRWQEKNLWTWYILKITNSVTISHFPDSGRKG